MKNSWFEQLTGFEEESPENVRAKIKVDGKDLVSLVNSRRFTFGRLEIPTLEELRKSVDIEKYKDKIRISEVVADVRQLHDEIENENALFQVASQFNLLEMVNPNVTPEAGIGRYEFDRTQGPICAMACGAGTIYRNYFVEVNGEIGQSENNQIDCLELMGDVLDNKNLNLWEMKNGYALVNEDGLQLIDKKIKGFSKAEREDLKGKLKTGIQWNTEVTVSKTKHQVSQIYCSALPVAYSSIEPHYWESFAGIILEALYEATLYAGVLNMKNNNSNLVYLTLVGGGAFGNKESWIMKSIQKAVKKFKNVPLDIRIVRYRRTHSDFNQYFRDFR